jgi:prepilin-type N-terminal cleavage/methylation domain-containing protein/prepilin-type processing-associated H-X9-DG protein
MFRAGNIQEAAEGSEKKHRLKGGRSRSVMFPTRYRGRKRGGFTLIELLVVVAIISLLVSLLLPSLQRAKMLARIAVCGTQLHGIGSGLHMYAQDYSGALPPYPRGAGSPEAITYRFRQVAPTYDLTRDLFYCPSRPEPVMGPGWDKETSWQGVHSPGQWYEGEAYVAYANLVGDQHWGGPDVCPRSLDEAAEPMPLFADIMLEYAGASPFLYVLNHADGPMGGGRYVSRLPAGANVVWVDGHVDWRAWNEAERRYTVPWKPLNLYW